MKENNGERAIKGFLRAYMAERKLHKAVAYLDKNIQWIGTGAAEHSCTYQETVAALPVSYTHLTLPTICSV